MKECNSCKEIKDFDCFNKDERLKCGLRGRCRDCHNKSIRDYYKRNSEKIKEQKKVYNKENKKKISRRNKLHYTKNKTNIKKYREKVKEKTNERDRNRYANDPNFKLKKLIRYNCWRVADGVKQQKELHSLEYLGCSLDEFKTHIESLWLEGMTWDNHGIHGWHIDHKVSLDYFVKNSDDPWKANHYTNLQPMWAEDNLSKGSSI